jgi:hypothetical protein
MVEVRRISVVVAISDGTDDIVKSDATQRARRMISSDVDDNLAMQSNSSFAVEIAGTTQP